ncbi:MAG: bifunctional aspartate kinase/homoserine dehydrogenase I [Gammaproteobacteria bacterium]|nr:bifunctional aspartate kinase/homoserine dehydrogenase I [Gammaproteobacteria bacterium]
MTVSNPSGWLVHKFGGSSLADASCFRRVAAILKSHPAEKLAVVLSACKGVTDSLFALNAEPQLPDSEISAALLSLRDRHVTLATELLNSTAAEEFIFDFDQDCTVIRKHLREVDLVVGYGEIWSTRLFFKYLTTSYSLSGECYWLDAREVIVVESGPLGPIVQWNESRKNIASLVTKNLSGILVITGFIASTIKGIPATLGRDGSDFSASIFGSLLEANEINIWTDVDGILSADPRIVPNAQVIDSLSYNEAMELAYFGAKVIHPQTMAPAIHREIPIWIRNTFAPDRGGTLICARPKSALAVKGISTIENIALVNIEGAGMIGVPGTAHRLFGVLREAGISVVLISQGSSEHSICFAVPLSQVDLALQVARVAFKRELTEGQIQAIDADRDLSILAVVGDGMAGIPGIAAKLFNALSAASVNVRAIAQGASERNISVVVPAKSATRALRAVHASFYLSAHTLSVGIIGPGTVGRVLIDQIASQSSRLRRDFKLDLRVRGLLSSKRMLLSEDGVSFNSWKEDFLSSELVPDLKSFVNYVGADYLPNRVIIDCTASSEVAKNYAHWLAAGIHIITPNKKANSAPMASYRELQIARRAGSSHYLYEATVGAGLPIVQTLRDLRETGDEITSIEGIFSGTLAYLFNIYDGSKNFSDIVLDAKQRGYTEPDPRDDLSGIDVARKLVILGREMGLVLELADVNVESLVPSGLNEGSIDEFFIRLPNYDADMRTRFENARAHGKVLRYVGRLTAEGSATVGIVELEATHSFSNIALTDNVVRFATRRYSNNPMIVQGPGAGPEVTAGGIFADLLRLSAYLGARL